jgi:beta-lactam-binding protein with PASTA domain
VARGTKVDLTVARRVASVLKTSVPNLVGQQEAAARTTLLRYGLKVGTVTKVPGAKNGDVVRQSPAAGARVPRGSSINLTVSTRRVVTVRVSVPNVVGMQAAAASAALRRVGLVVGAVTRATGIREGSVIRQLPSMGTRVARGSKVDLTVATRKVMTARVTVPAVVGLQEGAASALLRRSGLAVGTVTKALGALPGRVLRQSPSARANVVRGTKVNLVVAVKKTTGRPVPPTPARQLVAVPKVVGMTLGQARMALRKIGLDVGTVSRKRISGAKRGRIASQTPKAGSRAAKGTKVNLVFAN